MPVLELHPAVFDANHRADVAGLHVLDNHAEFYWQFGRLGLARVVRVASQNVRAVTIIHLSDPRNVVRQIRHATPCQSRRMRPSASVTLPVNIKIASINGHIQPASPRVKTVLARNSCRSPATSLLLSDKGRPYAWCCTAAVSVL